MKNGLKSLTEGVEMGKMNGYDLSRNWFNYSFENPDKVKPIHTAVFMWCVEKCNRLGWKKKFGLPTSEAMEAIGVSNKNTYLKALNELIDWGFITLVRKSLNQHQSRIVAIPKIDTARGTALDTALIQHCNSTVHGTDTIDKPRTNNQETINIPFDDFWDLYDKKKDRKKCEKKWNGISESEKEKIMQFVPIYKKSQPDEKFRKNPYTFLNSEIWNDDWESYKKNGTDETRKGVYYI